VRIWIDMTAPAHPVVFRPLIAWFTAQGHEVEVTARDYAETLGLLDRFGIEHVAMGRHGGASRSRKLLALVGRSPRMRRFARRRRFDLALAHGSNDLPIAARSLGVPAVDMWDYEWATWQHRIGSHLARRVLVPDRIPSDRLHRLGAGPDKLVRFPGLKEDYYLHDFEPDASVLERLRLDAGRVIVVIRPPPDVSLYHRKSNRLFPQVLDRLGRSEEVHAVVIPRTREQRKMVSALDFPSLVVPDGPVDAQSLIALSDLVISAGGTMNREAVSLGVPVYTTYGGRLGGVDEALMREGRLRPLADVRAIELVKRTGPSERMRRDPAWLCERMLEAAA
jgi:uncharacterized protein